MAAAGRTNDGEPDLIETRVVKTRFRNSTMASTSDAPAVSMPRVAVRPVGQPEPEPVSRTAPPVTMITARSSAAGEGDSTVRGR